MHWVSNWSRRKPKRAHTRKTPTPSISTCVAGPRCSSGRSSRRRRSNLVAVRAGFDRGAHDRPERCRCIGGRSCHLSCSNTYFGWTNPETDYDAKVLGQADRSIALAPDNIYAYMTKGIYFNISLRPNDGLRVANAGLAINPNAAYLYGVRSTAETYLRQFEQARSDVEQAMRLSPRDPRMGQWHELIADAELGLGHFDAAIDEANNAIDAGYRFFYSYLNLAAAHALEGDIDQAKAAPRRSSPPQSQAQRQMAGRAQTRSAARVRRAAQGGAAGRVSARSASRNRQKRARPARQMPLCDALAGGAELATTVSATG